MHASTQRQQGAAAAARVRSVVVDLAEEAVASRKR
jgi:hypothetical protein